MKWPRIWPTAAVTHSSGLSSQLLMAFAKIISHLFSALHYTFLIELCCTPVPAWIGKYVRCLSCSLRRRLICILYIIIAFWHNIAVDFLIPCLIRNEDYNSMCIFTELISHCWMIQRFTINQWIIHEGTCFLHCWIRCLDESVKSGWLFAY